MQRRVLARRISIAIYGSPRTCRAVLSPPRLPPHSFHRPFLPAVFLLAPRPSLSRFEIRNASSLLFETPLSTPNNFVIITPINSLLLINQILIIISPFELNIYIYKYTCKTRKEKKGKSGVNGEREWRRRQRNIRAWLIHIDPANGHVLETRFRISIGDFPSSRRILPL